MAEQDPAPGPEGAAERVTGIVTDPDSPIHVGDALARTVRDWLEDQTGDAWRVEVRGDASAAGAAGSSELLETVSDLRRDAGWEYVIAVTDLPLLLQDRPAVAEWNVARAAAVVSLPALGILIHARLRRATLQVLRELTAETEAPEEAPAAERPGMAVQRHASDDGATRRYSLPRVLGWGILVLGMVRASAPWRLMLGLSKALAAALATSAFGLSSTTVWMIGDLVPPWRKVVIAVVSILLLVGWLILSHRLWEDPFRRQQGHRRLGVLYNTSMVVTLLLGVVILYAALMAVNVLVVWLVVPDPLIETTLGHADTVASTFGMAWAFTTMGVLAGALGSSLESDEAVRQAAYGRRESHRLETLRSGRAAGR